MICKYCKGDELPAGAVYCCWCGKKLKKDKAEISVPAPRRRADGLYTAQLMIKGQRVYVPAQPTEAKYYAAARALKAELSAPQTAPAKITLEKACEAYVEKRSAVLSPSTSYGYEAIYKNRFAAYMKKDVRAIDYQAMINAEATKCNAKTLKNSWGFIKSVLKEQDVTPPKVTLPQVVKPDLPWLDEKQIKIFIDKMQGKSAEIGALLGLHGLRRSEILAITPAKIKDGFILVEGAAVHSSDGMVVKETNKNQSSRRKVPIMIPRLQQLVDASTCAPDERYIKGAGDTLYDQIQTVCAENDLPAVGVHGLRRSFVTLAFTTLGWSERECMAVGGWSDYQTMHKIYIKLSESKKDAAAEKMAAFYSNDKIT